MEDGGQVRVQASFTSCGLGSYAFAFNLHSGKKTSRWTKCDALGNVLLRNPGPKHSCVRQFDTCHPPYLNIIADQLHLYSPMAVTAFSRKMHPATLHKLFRNGLRNTASNFPRSQTERASVGCAGTTSPNRGGSTSHLARLKGTAANDLVRDTTEHLQRSMLQRVRAVLEAPKDHQHINQVVIMFWPIGVCVCWRIFV